jgi:hypothetical protein
MPDIKDVAPEAQDVAAIQAYLKNAGAQAYAAVENCSPPLDAATRARVDDLAKRIYAFVSAEWAQLLQMFADPLATARKLRDEFNAMIVELQVKGCGDIAKAIHDAPPPVQAPPPEGTPNPLLRFLNPQALELEALFVLWLLYEWGKGRR